ncbi:MAG: ATP-binding protein [Nocardiopsaceae bacterium]|nr:ATP-binding protein [Nocardiopsaceae bacterium]
MAASMGPHPGRLAGTGTPTGQRCIPGTFGAARDARRYAATVLGAGHPALADTELVMSELVANAARHTRSGLSGGEIGVAVEHVPAGVRVEVIDAGPLTTNPAIPLPRTPGIDAEQGRGLLLVEAVTTDWGTTRHPNGYRSVWAIIPAPDEDSPNAP